MYLRPTYRPTNSSQAICPLFFERGGIKNSTLNRWRNCKLAIILPVRSRVDSGGFRICLKWGSKRAGGLGAALRPPVGAGHSSGGAPEGEDPGI